VTFTATGCGITINGTGTLTQTAPGSTQFTGSGTWTGPGGQSVNTTDSAVRLTHVPTGIVVQCQDEKSQHRNKEKAMSVLKARILDLKRREEADRIGKARRSLIGSGDRSERVRTYNFPQNRLTDHRINLTLYSLDRVMEGDIGALVTALRAHDVELRLLAELTPDKT